MNRFGGALDSAEDAGLMIVGDEFSEIDGCELCCLILGSIGCLRRGYVLCHCYAAMRFEASFNACMKASRLTHGRLNPNLICARRHSLMTPQKQLFLIVSGTSIAVQLTFSGWSTVRGSRRLNCYPEISREEHTSGKRCR